MTSRQGTAGLPKVNTRPETSFDFYASPYEALPPLLCAEGDKLPKTLWEPACGNGALVIPLRNRGFRVLASDIVDRGCPDACRQNFLLATEPLADGIVTNPPFDGAAGGIEDFTKRAVMLAPYVAILARFAWYESTGRHYWWNHVGLSRIIKIADRLPMMHREGYTGPRHSNAGQCFAWFIFEKGRTRRPYVPVYSRLWKKDAKQFPMNDDDLPPTAIEQRLPLFAGIPELRP